MTDESASLLLDEVQAMTQAVRANVARVIVGKLEVIDLLLVALLSDGHVLLEDVPGMGKTVMAKALARSLGATFQRVQGTPDLLPTDVTGVSYFDQRKGEFVFRPGPVFAQVLLVDEINRATPRTQNPVELEGTFPLPEAQLDRFLLRVRVGYPSEEDEETILHRFKREEPLESLQPVVSAERLLALQQVVRQV